MRSTRTNRGWAAVTVAAIVMMLAAAIVAPAQSFTTLVNFNRTNGAVPYYASLVQGTDGNLYGTTSTGGNTSCNPPKGCGTVFKVAPTGTLTTLYDFDLTHGKYPFAGLVLGTDGNFYGTTTNGGVNNEGTVFRMTPEGKLTTLLSFNNLVNGAYPYAGLVQGTDGNFYGTTTYGGADGVGTIFRITPAGKLATLHDFTGGSDGANPFAPLIEGTDGNFYGTAYNGGSNYGTVFKLAPDGAFTTLHSFNYTDGGYPFGGLVQDTNGSFYGTTLFGGAIGVGTVFRIASGGALTTLHSFDSTDGANPSAGLVQAPTRISTGRPETGALTATAPFSE